MTCQRSTAISSSLGILFNFTLLKQVYTIAVDVLQVEMKNNEMKNSKTTYYWFGIFAICFLCFQVVSYYVRPNYSGENAVFSYFLGIAPNFFPAIGIPALFVVIMMQLKTSSNWLNKKSYITANLISVTGLIAWEFIQTSSKKLHFDWNDIIWTIIGAAIFQLIWILTPERLK